MSYTIWKIFKKENKELVYLRSRLDHAENPGLPQELLSVGVSDPLNSFQPVCTAFRLGRAPGSYRRERARPVLTAKGLKKVSGRKEVIEWNRVINATGRET